MYIKVRVIAGARKEVVTKVSDTHYNISVREKALRNSANHRVLEIIALEYNVGVHAVKIVNGHHSPVKMLSVEAGK